MGVFIADIELPKLTDEEVEKLQAAFAAVYQQGRADEREEMLEAIKAVFEK